MTAPVVALLAELGHAHDFTDAPCVGRWRWFDPPGEREPAASVQSRHEAAAHLCGTCPLPTFARCAALSRTLPKPGGTACGPGAATTFPPRKATHDRDPPQPGTPHTLRAPPLPVPVP